MPRTRPSWTTPAATWARYAKLAKGDFIAAQQYETQRALVRQYEGTVEADKAAVDSARLQLDYSRITAPVGGRLGLRNVDEGNQIKSSDSDGLVRITEVSPCDVLFTLPESQVPLVARALREREENPSLPPLPVQAWDREQKHLLAVGSLLSLDNQIDAATGTVKLKARFPNQDGALYPNQFVNARLMVRMLKDAVTIPASAVQLGLARLVCLCGEQGRQGRQNRPCARGDAGHQHGPAHGHRQGPEGRGSGGGGRPGPPARRYHGQGGGDRGDAEGGSRGVACGCR